MPLFGSFKNTKLISVVFVLVVLLVIAGAYALFTSLTRKSYDNIVDLNARQTEIIRVAALASGDTDPSTKTYAATVYSITASEKTATSSFLKKKLVKVTPKQLAARHDSTIDSSLKTATQVNNYDVVFLGKLDSLIISYEKAEKAVTGTSDSASEKALFATFAANSKLLTGK